MKNLFLPGFMCDARLFEPQMAHLFQFGHACQFVALDRQDSIGDMAAFALAQSDDPLVLVGLSMGGIVALEAVRQAPERVSALALLNATPFEDSLGDARLEQIAGVNRDGVDKLYMDVLKPQYIAAENRHADLMNLVVDMARDLGPAVFERQSQALADRSGFEALLPEIRQKVLILTGSEDLVCGLETAQYMQARINNAALTCVPNCGHLSTLEQPQMVADALVAFLGDL